jgi:tRNA 5-methylaminomethyl-2-thiouridine biosynthesis bifunctional protein
MSKIAVVGLGLAGACMVRALAKYAGERVEVVVYEAAAAPATRASGNPLGVVHPLISKDWNLASQLYAAGIAETWRWCKDLSGERAGWALQCGALRMPDSVLEPSGGWVQPLNFVEACLADARERLGDRLSVHFNAPIDARALRALRETSHAVVLCTAGAALGPWSDGLCLNRIAGQLSWLPVDPSEGPPRVVCGDGYVAPVVQSRLVVGASFDRLLESEVESEGEPLDGRVSKVQREAAAGFPPHNDNASNTTKDARLAVTAQGHEGNRRRLEALLPELATRMADRWSMAQGRTSVRVATRDRLPHIGLLWDESVELPRSVSRLEQMPRQRGLYLLLGLGARGLSVAPMAADALAQWILNDAPPQGRIWQAVDPARFVLRAHQRGLRPAN